MGQFQSAFRIGPGHLAITPQNPDANESEERDKMSRGVSNGWGLRVHSPTGIAEHCWIELAYMITKTGL